MEEEEEEETQEVRRDKGQEAGAPGFFNAFIELKRLSSCNINASPAAPPTSRSPGSANHPCLRLVYPPQQRQP